MSATVIHVGDRVSKKFVMKAEDVKTFGDLVDDHNPIHSDPETAKAAGFAAPLCYGMLVSSYISGVLAYRIPGPNSVYLSQNLKFVAPVFVGDEIEVVVEVLQFRKDKGLLSLSTCVYKKAPEGGSSSDPILCVQGSAVCMNKGAQFEGESEWTVSK